MGLESLGFWSSSYEVSEEMMFRQFQCHDCGSTVAFRSRPRSLLERYILLVLLLRPVRCGDCFCRYYRTVFMEVRERGPGFPRAA